MQLTAWVWLGLWAKNELQFKWLKKSQKNDNIFIENLNFIVHEQSLTGNTAVHTPAASHQAAVPCVESP